LDEVALEEVNPGAPADDDPYQFYLIKWEDYRDTYSTDPDFDINNDASIYADISAQTLKTGIIHVSRDSVTKEGGNYVFTIRIVGNYGRYVLLVRGKDKDGHKLIAAQNEDGANLYGVNVQSTSLPPVIIVKKINGTSGNGPNGKVIERVYAKKDTDVPFTINLDKSADVEYKLSGQLSWAAPILRSPGDSEIILPKGFFDQTNGGTYQLFIKATADSATSTEQTYHIGYDVKPPEVIITSPVNNEVRKEDNKKITISGTAFDAGSGLKSPNPVTVKIAKVDGSNSFPDRDLTPVNINGENWNTDEIDLSTTGYGEGKYTLTVKGADKLDQSSELTRTFIYDAEPPQFTAVNISNGDGSDVVSVSEGATVYRTTNSIKVSGSATDSYGIATVTVNNNAATHTGGTFAASLTLSHDGNHDITIKAVDKAGRDVSRKITVVVDTEDPSITPTNWPPAAVWQKTRTVSVSGTASDSTSGLAKVEAIVNGIPTVLGTTSSWSGYLTLNEGSNTVKFKVTDKAGKFKETNVETIKVDTGKPIITLVTPSDGQALIKGSSYTVTVTPADSTGGSGIARVEYSQNADFTGSNNAAIMPDGSATSTLGSIPELGATYYFRAVDNAGNESDSVRVNVRKDTTGPTITVIAPTGEYISTKRPKFEASITDSAGINASTAKVHYKKDSETSETTEALTGNSGSYSFTPTSDLDGKKYEFWFTAQDTLGNETTSAHTTVTIDTDYPKLENVEVDTKADATVYSNTGTVMVSGKATDANGVVKVEILENDSAKKDTTSINATTGAWTINLTGTDLPDGTHNLTIRATDKAKKTAEVQKTVVVDKTKPDVTLNTVEGTAVASLPTWQNKQTLKFEGTASDSSDGSGIKEVEAIIKKGSSAETTEVLGSASPWSGYLTLAEGVNTVKFRVTDKAGNTEETAARTINVDSKPPNQPVITDVDGKGKTSVLTVSGKTDITIKGTITDDAPSSNIAKVQWKLDTKDGTGTLKTNVTPNEWAINIPKDDIKDGSVMITATDKAGNTSIPIPVVFIKDETAPTAKITNFDKHTAQTGKITVIGSVTDTNVDSSATKWKIVPKAEAAPAIDNLGADTSWTKVDKPGVATWEITTLDLGSYFTQSGGVYSSDYTTEHTSADGLFHLPLYLYVEDTTKNAAVIKLDILVDPAGDKPVIEITEPVSPLAADPENNAVVVGGTVRVYGNATVKKGNVGKVFIDVAKDPGFTDFVTGWQNKQITGGANWSCKLNEHGEIDALIPSDKTTIVVYYRVWGENGETHTTGGYSEIQMLKFDKGAPIITPAKFGKTEASAKEYDARSWISGDDNSLYFKIQDASGIKQVVLKINDDSYTYTHTLPPDSATEINGIANCPHAIATFTRGLQHGSYYDYGVIIPLKTVGFAANKEYTVSIEVTEGTQTGDKYLTQFAQYVFRCDNKKPKGVFGKYADSDGSFNFNGTTVPSGIDASSQTGNYLFIDGETCKIEASGLTPSITGQHHWALYKEADYLVQSAEIGGLVYDDGGSGLKKITGKLLLSGVEKKTFSLDKETAGKKISGLKGDLYSWYEAFDVTALDDGKYTIEYTATDEAGNTSDTITRTVYIKNHELSITKLRLGTNLNRDGEIKGIHDELYDFAVNGKTDSYTKRFTAAPTISNFALKYKGDGTKPSGLIAIETGGTGQGNITYTLKLNGIALSNHTNKSLPAKESAEGDLKGFRKIVLSYDDVQAIAANGSQSFVLEIHDSPVGYTPPAAPTDAPARMDMTIDTAFNDATSPSGSITPLYWNSAADNSLKGNDTANGHIEIQATDKMNASYGNKHPAVSGTIVLRGVAYDETLLSSIKLTGLPDVSPAPEITYQNGTWSNTPGFEVKDVLTTDGHYAVWSYEWATGHPKKNVAVSLVVQDAASSPHSIGSAHSAVSKTAAKRNVRNATFDSVEGLKPGQQLRFVSDTDKDVSYLVVIETIDATAKTVSWPNGTDVPTGLTECFVYTAESNEPTLTVNVVPYITGIVTKLDTAYSSNPSVFNRSAKGEYPVRNDEIITVKGFNLAPSSGNPTVSIGTKQGPSTANEIRVKLRSSDKSGNLDITVNGIKSINNLNSNAAYNMKPNGANNDLLNDDTKLHVWKFATVRTDKGVRYPTMRIGKDSNQTVGFVYGSGAQHVRMNVQGQTFTIDCSYTQWYDTACAVDDTGKIYGAAMNGDSGANGTHSYNKHANFGFYAWNTYNVPGQTYNRDAQLGFPTANGDGAYSSGLKKVALENSYDGVVFASNRIVSPKIATKGAGNVYMAYYDASQNTVKFRYGNVSGDPDTDGVQLTFNGGLGNHSNNGTGSAAGAVGIASGDTTGPYVAVGVVPEGPDAGRALVAWYDSKNQQLVYKYSTSASSYTDWSDVKVIDTGFVGWYVDLVADKDGGIHIAYYSAQNGDLKYAYLSKYDATPQTYFVDSYLSVGTNITIEVSDTKKPFTKYKVNADTGAVTENGTESRYVPYISSYMSSFMRTQNSVRVAWLADIKPDVIKDNTGKYKANSSKSFADGVKNDKYTGTWEAMTVPTTQIPLDYTVGVGIKKNASHNQSVMLGYGTTAGLETAILE